MHWVLRCRQAGSCVRHYAKQSNEMKFLNVAEKNDAAKTIAGLLSNGTARRREGYSVYNKIFDFEAQVRGRNAQMTMTSVSGHLMQLEFLASYRNWRSIDPQTLFDAPVRKAIGEDYQPIKRTLEREIRGCQGLIIWTDCDREGENIGFEIINVCQSLKPNLTIYRATFSEITGTAVRRALQQLGQPDKRQSEAVDVRTELDLRTGAAITRFQTMRLQRLFPEKIADKLISYGSCQIPTLGFVVERYMEIEAFVSEAFWKIKVLHTIDDLTVEFNWARNRLFDKEACENYLLLCLADPRAKVENVSVKPKHKWRPTALDTVEMEKLGSRKLKLSAKETMSIAEKLYTKGFISYPRTETNQFSKDFDLAPLVEQQTGHNEWGDFAQRVLNWGPNPRNGNKSDQAHPPIHPTKLVTNLSGNEARVYELIVRHFLACVSKDAVGSETIVNIDIAGEKFNANGLVIYERNYLDVYVYEKWNAKQIHHYERDQIFEPTEISLHEGATTPPPLLTEADLIALMEKHGIGTDATHAEHINTIKERGYIGVVDKGALVPGVIGMGLYEGYAAMELSLSKPLLRAEFEADLKLICLGQKDPKLVLTDQIRKYKEAYQQIMEKITAMDAKIAQRLNETPTAATAQSTNADSAPLMQELHQCPKCNVAPLALKPKRNQTGFFISCLNFPDCKNAIWLPDVCKEPTVLQESCTRCGGDYKLLKFKFSTAYYRTLFNAPHGWYKTCLRCDAEFRNSFNINVDCVKAVGGIVGEVTTNRWRSGGGAAPARPSSTAANRGGGNSSQRGNAKSRNPTTRTNRANTTTTSSQGSLRSFFSASSNNNAESTGAFDEFFDSNDGFEAQMLAAADSVESATGVPSSASHVDDDIAAAFAADDDADFEALINGGSNSGAPPPSPPPGGGVAMDNNIVIANSDCNSTFSGWQRQESSTISIQNAEVPEPFVWGTASGALSAPKRARLSDPNNGTTMVLCSGCHQPALEHTVKRDGPNKGRQFYKCAKPNACKFFQWADDATSSGSAGNNSWNTTTTTTSNSEFQRLSETTNGNNNSAASMRSNTNGSVTITQRATNQSGDSSADNVQCKCEKPAKKLTVRKEGPNKGRTFYACAVMDKSCGFFQWGDDEVNENRETSNTYRRDGAGRGGSRSNSNSQRGRRCGLCRQEGHTRSKCPRKAEFDY